MKNIFRFSSYHVGKLIITRGWGGRGANIISLVAPSPLPVPFNFSFVSVYLFFLLCVANKSIQ